MTEATQGQLIPEWTLGDRLGKALSAAGIGPGEMASYLDIHRNTVSAYINDRQPIKRQTLMLWAMRTGVPLEWLEAGEMPSGPTPPAPTRPRGTRPNTLGQTRRRGRSGDTRTTDEYVPPLAS